MLFFLSITENDMLSKPVKDLLMFFISYAEILNYLEASELFQRCCVTKEQNRRYKLTAFQNTCNSTVK